MRVQLMKGCGGMIVCMLTIGCLLYFRYVVPYHICFKEQIQLFVFSLSYLSAYLLKSAALACLGGDFLTQFLYFKWGGALVVTLLLLVEWGLVYRVLRRFSFEKSLSMLAVALVPVIIDCVGLADISFSLAISVSSIIALGAFLVYAKMDGKIALVSGIILIPLLYIFSGASVFLFVVLVALFDLHNRQKRWIYWAIIVGLAMVLPVALRHTYLLTLKQAYTYPFPDIWLMLSAVATILVVCLTMGANRWYSMRFQLIISFSLLAFLLFVLPVKKPDGKQEKIFGISIEAYHTNWDKVLAIAQSDELQNPVAASYTNIALAQRGLLGERLMDFYQPFASGLILPCLPHNNWLVLFSANDALFHIGDMEMAQHAAMVGMIASPRQRSARLTERLAEINRATGDVQAAAKYQRILATTLFHKNNPERLTTLPRQTVFNKDTIRSAFDVKISLELLTESQPGNLPAVDYLLCYYLLNKDISAFFQAYTSYVKGKNAPVPKVYAQALLVYFAATKSTGEEVAAYGIAPDMIRAFGEYTRLYEVSNGSLERLQEKFAGSYWVYYHFAVKAG